MTSPTYRWFLAALFVLAAVNSAAATEWGTLTGRFIYDGKPPAPAKLDTSSKPDPVCTKHAIFDESLVVGDDGGMANVAIWLRKKPSEVHPDYAKAATGKVILDNHSCRFDPHVVAMREGQTLEIKNSDDTGHNTNAGLNEGAFNVIIPASQSSDKKIDKAENLPAPVTCNIHPWMKGWMLVRPDPYFSVSDKGGKFEIKNLPAGKYEFQVWQEKSGYVEKASMGGRDAGWKKGRFTFEVKPGSNDLGEIKLSPDNFKK